MMPGTLEPSARLKSSGTILKQSAIVRRRDDDARVVALPGAQHLPQVALLGLGRHARGRAGALDVDADDRDLHHRRRAQRLGHEREAAAGGGAHGAAAGVRGADGHVDDAISSSTWRTMMPSCRAWRAIQCSTPVDGLIG